MLHSHHILPKYAGGTDDPSNKVLLTVEAHATAHRLLWEMYGRKEDWLAWQGLAGLIGKDEIMQEVYKLNSVKICNLWKSPAYRQRNTGHTGKLHSPETKQKLRAAKLGTTQSPATRQRRSEAMKLAWKRKPWSTRRSSDAHSTVSNG